MASNSDIDRAIGNVLKYADREPWARRRATYFTDKLSDIVERFSMTDEQLHARVDGLGVGDMLFGFLSEAFMTEEFDGTGTSLIAEYLKRRGWQETARARRYLEALRDSLPSLYEVIDVAPGEWVDVRDIVRPSPAQRVMERRGSEQLVRWDRLGARVLEVNGERVFAGGMFYFAREAGDAIQRVLLGSLERFAKEYGHLFEARGGNESPTPFADEVLRSSPRAFVEVWLTHALEASGRPLPELHNTDGHPLLFSRARLPVSGTNSDEIVERLSVLSAWERESPDVRIWQRHGGPLRTPGGETTRKKKTRGASAAKTPAVGAMDDTPRTIVATAELEAEALVVETNSRERMAAVLGELRMALSELVGEPLIRYENAEAALKAPRSSRDTINELPRDAASSTQLVQVLHQFKEQHYRRTLDDKLPVLGNRTPRQCARDPKRRAQVIAWLKDIENGEQRQARASGQPPFDVRWMWRELGVEEPR